jgi:DmsE family decaheme c-type cytochrome
VSALAQPKAVAQTKQAPANIVTGQACFTCHEDVVLTFPVSVHGKTAQFLKGTQAATCETCHGDGTKHNESGRPRDILTPGKMPAAQATEMCLLCHSRDETHVNFRGSPHDRKDMTCASCHKEHHTASEKLVTRTGLVATPVMRTQVSEKLLKQPTQDLCMSCHKDKRKATMQRSTHLFATEHGDAKVTCTSCHNPHGGEGRTMLVASSNTQLCYGCHAEKRGPFLWEHTPARENCNTCHVAHGSNNLNLLKARPTVLCQNCHMHMLWRHQTVAGFDMFTFNQGCINCHGQIHGSNHPSGRAFTH